MRPDEVIPPERGAAVQLRGVVRDLASLVPNLVKLLARLVRDPRVPRRSKILVGAVVAYLISPLDLVPDAIPLLGVADDVLLAVYAVNHMLQRAGEEVVLEHWDGPQDLLEMVRSVLDAVGQVVPGRIRRWVDRLG